MIHRFRRVLPAVLLSLVAASPVFGQDTTQRGVRIGLTYQAGSRPGVLVLPVRGTSGDSVRAIVERDLDYGDRVSVLTGAVAANPPAGSSINYRLMSQLGAAAIVQMTLTATGLHVAVHDVANQSVLQVDDFPLTSTPNSPAWRAAVHSVSDRIEQWITGTTGIANTKILFVRSGRIYSIDSDGANEVAVTDPGPALSPTWHPSGQQIAYSIMGQRGTQVYIRDLGTGTARRLVATPGGLNITPAFSPDGRSIVYAHGLDEGTDLVLAQAFETSPGRKITVGRGTDNVSPSFSPDGRRIAFTSGRSGHPEVYIMDADGTNAELLTPFNFGDQNYRSNPDWSPDGRLIAFQSQIGGRFQVMTIALRDRSIKQHTSEGQNEDPSWAPDGRHLVFTSSRSGTRQLWVLDVESGRARQLTRGAGARLAAWSPRLDRSPRSP